MTFSAVYQVMFFCLFLQLPNVGGIEDAGDWFKALIDALDEESIKHPWNEEDLICPQIDMPCIKVKTVLKQLSKLLTNASSPLKRKLITILVELSAELVNSDNEDISEIADSIIESINDILDVSIEEILEAQDENSTSSDILGVIDILTEKIAKDAQNGKETRIEKNNLGIASKRINNTDENIWIYSTTGTEKMSVDIANSVNKSSTRSAVLKLPKGTLRKNDAIVAFAYRNDALFLRSQADATSKRLVRVNSIILSATVGNRTISNLQNPVVMEFQKKNTTESTASCVFWRSSQNNISNKSGEWAKLGCTKLNESSTSVFCECDHLTNFAILFDVSQTESNPLELQIITWIGCSVSLAGLLFTIVTYLVFRTLRKSLPPKILLFLCVNLGVLLIVFLAGTEQTSPLIGCQLVAAILQYFLLSSFCWMLVEGFNLYRNVVVVYVYTAQTKFLTYASLFAQGLPAVIVIVTGISSPSELGNDNFCVVNGNAFYFGILVPICCVLVINTGCLVAVMYRLTHRKAKEVNQNDSNKKSALINRARVAFTCIIILGLTWIFAVFALGSAATVFQWIFAILNSLQGLFIFIFHTLRNDDVRMIWLKCVGRSRETTSTNNTHTATKANTLTVGISGNSPDVSVRNSPEPLMRNQDIRLQDIDDAKSEKGKDA